MYHSVPFVCKIKKVSYITYPSSWSVRRWIYPVNTYQFIVCFSSHNFREKSITIFNYVISYCYITLRVCNYIPCYKYFTDNRYIRTYITLLNLKHYDVLNNPKRTLFV